MTQVVNAYRAWRFAQVDVRLISSRDGSRGLRGVGRFLRAARSIRRIGDPSQNLVVVHLSQGGSFVREGALLRLARRRGYATVAHLHGSSFVEFARRRPALVAKVLTSASRVFVLSDAMHEAVASVVASDRIAIVPNAVPAGHPGPKERRVVFGGSVSRRKGVDVLIDAWRTSGAGRGWHLDVAGPITEPDLVPGSLPDATFHGALPHGRLMRMLDEAEVAVLPSRDEAMPMFILEAMARDVCVIGTSVGGVPRVLGGGAGMLVEPGCSASLAHAFDQVLGSDARRHELAAAGARRFHDRHSAATLYPELERLWLETLESRT
ncbi:glycosyltransferase family 4 protein [Agromyces binzhouensis]|uniref:glycosyltransferase family 4 protein n=1 Tax=Agromyces binzhouensis TaxID=1817495 RepID=UPI0036258210